MIPRELPPLNQEERERMEFRDEFCDRIERDFHEFLNKALQKVIKEKRSKNGK